MRPLTIHRALLDAIDLLYSPFLPSDTPADTLRNDAVRYLKSQLAVIETPILADDSYECGACGEVVENGETHDCPAADWNDSSAGQYAANVAKVM
jgi:hypothetical protein